MVSRAQGGARANGVVHWRRVGVVTWVAGPDVQLQGFDAQWEDPCLSPSALRTPPTIVWTLRGPPVSHVLAPPTSPATRPPHLL